LNPRTVLCANSQAGKPRRAREDLESILVLATLLAGLKGNNCECQRPMQAGVVTWFVAISVVGDLMLG
jgi:hypothetical protein